jgi:hypothetical protein
MGGFKRSSKTPKIRGVDLWKEGAGFMVLVVEPCPVPSPKGSLHQVVKEAGRRVGLEAHTPITSLRWYFKKKVVFEQGEIKWNVKKCFTEMDEDGNLKNGIRVEMD